MRLPGLPACLAGAHRRSGRGSPVCVAHLAGWRLLSETELTDVRGDRTARQLGHLPVGGSDGSLARLDPKVRSRVVYTHLNNTNPLLDRKSAASRKLGRAGAAVAADGQIYEL